MLLRARPIFDYFIILIDRNVNLTPNNASDEGPSLEMESLDTFSYLDVFLFGG